MWLRFQTSTACSSNVFLSDHTHPPSSHAHVFSFPVLFSACRQRRRQRARDVTMSRAGAPGSSGPRPLLFPECALSTRLGYFWLPLRPPSKLSVSPHPHTHPPSLVLPWLREGWVQPSRRLPIPRGGGWWARVPGRPLGGGHAVLRAHLPGPVGFLLLQQ